MKVKDLVKLPEQVPDCHDDDGCDACNALDDYIPCEIEMEAHNDLLEKIGDMDVKLSEEKFAKAIFDFENTPVIRSRGCEWEDFGNHSEIREAYLCKARSIIFALETKGMV